MFSIKSETIITSLFRKLTNISTNNFKIDNNGISDPLEMCKNKNKSILIKQIEILSHPSPEVHYTDLTLSPFNSQRVGKTILRIHIMNKILSF